MREWKVPFYVPYIDEMEKEALARVIDRKQLSMGEEVEAFEVEAAEVLGAPEGHECVAVSNATAGLFLLCKYEGPEVKIAVPNLTFCATINAVIASGNRPVICDVDYNGIMLRSAYEKTEQAIFVTYAGYIPGDLPKMTEIGNPIIDQAHSFQPRAFRPDSVWSFYGNKNIACGEGGLIGVDSDKAEHMRLDRDHGRGHGKFKGYQIDGELNFRICELQAAVLRVQLKKLDEIMDAKARIRELYNDILNEHVVVPAQEVTHLYFIRMPSAKRDQIKALMPSAKRDQIKALMAKAGIECSVHYKPLSQFTCYKKYVPKGADLSFSEYFGASVLSLPFWPGMSDSEVEFVADTLIQSLKSA